MVTWGSRGTISMWSTLLKIMLTPFHSVNSCLIPIGISAEDLSERDSIGSELCEKVKKYGDFILINRMFAGF